MFPESPATRILRGYFPDYRSGSIFTLMSQNHNAPWPEEVGNEMDKLYFEFYSGLKVPSDFAMMNTQDEIADSASIASLLWTMFSVPWTRLWDAYNMEYSPIENYNIGEITDREQTDDRDITKQIDYTRDLDETEKTTTSDDDTYDSTVDYNSTQKKVTEQDTTVTVDDTQVTTYGKVVKTSLDSDDFRYGFNSVNKVPTQVQIDTGTETNSGQDTVKDNSTTVTDFDSTDDVTRQDKTVEHSTDNRTGNKDVAAKTAIADKTAETTTDDDSLKEHIDKTRKGIVGQNTYQELLQQEFDLWKWNYFKAIFDDCDSLLTLALYDDCLVKFSRLEQQLSPAPEPELLKTKRTKTRRK